MSSSQEAIDILQNGFKAVDCRLAICRDGERILLLSKNKKTQFFILDNRILDDYSANEIEEAETKCVICGNTLTKKYLTNQCGCTFHMLCMRNDLKKRQPFACKCGKPFTDAIKERLLKKSKSSQETEQQREDAQTISEILFEDTDKLVSEAVYEMSNQPPIINEPSGPSAKFVLNVL